VRPVSFVTPPRSALEGRAQVQGDDEFESFASVAENLLQQDFTTPRPNQVWLCDIAYISTDEGCFYLAVVLDVCSRKVMGFFAGGRQEAR